MNQRKKTAVIFVNRADGSKLVLNPNDLKELKVKDGTAEFTTSSGKHAIRISNYALSDKLKPALLQRYNIIDLEAGQPIKVTNTGKTHSLVVIHDQGAATFIFPKSFVGLTVDGAKVTVRSHLKSYVVNGVVVRGDEFDQFEAVKMSA